jgi:hypothetical protein
MTELPIHTVLEVVRDGAGAWDTRTIDMNLGFRGVKIDRGILAVLRELEELGLLHASQGDRRSTGPIWSITEKGVRWLQDHCDFGD